MSFLLGDEYVSSSSSSESDGEEETPVQVMTAEKVAVDKAPAQLLPSADSVLSSVAATKASFLPPKNAAVHRDTIKTFDLIKEKEEQRLRQEKEGREQRESERIDEKSRKRRPPAEATNREQPAKREKQDATDRVKGQRIKGQAGIGSDFRGWKTETEMALRQQFD